MSESRASCLCGGVKIRAVLQPNTASHCHCSMCRKQHGAAFGSYINVKVDDLVYEQGEDLVQMYRSSDIASRAFCRVCGSTLLFIDHERPGIVGLALGILDDEPDTRPVEHIFYADRPSWSGPYDDGLPKYDGDTGL
ncbi:GFA family protein [Saccharospirillum mangrovi]|uniref:GFA family protein n=1 Tax=Saccharospirillum mangrovi TaxID=2161747 RepID=UPI000D3598C0|nr:GFA family protein [Saccharospirillum mangrovi]